MSQLPLNDAQFKSGQKRLKNNHQMASYKINLHVPCCHRSRGRGAPIGAARQCPLRRSGLSPSRSCFGIVHKWRHAYYDLSISRSLAQLLVDNFKLVFFGKLYENWNEIVQPCNQIATFRKLRVFKSVFSYLRKSLFNGLF